MKRKVFVVLMAAGLFALNVSGQTPQEPEFSATVTGQVLNDEGRPVANAEVCGHPTMIPWVGPLPCGDSDSKGKFSLHVWVPAEYVITAAKEKDGYPDAHNGFYGSPAVVFPSLVVTENKARQEVTIQLGLPYGKVIGKIVDAETNKPIEIVSIEMHHANTPANFIKMGTSYSKGRLRLLLPPVPVIFKISAEGYQDWWYGADGSEERAESLHIALGSTRELIISLQPISKSK